MSYLFSFITFELTSDKYYTYNTNINIMYITINTGKIHPNITKTMNLKINKINVIFFVRNWNKRSIQQTKPRSMYECSLQKG